jgi:very-short-patch-repair endonuclease
MRRQRVHAVDLMRARTMRIEPTSAEARLWEELRDRRMGGFKFRRQYSMDSYILDFYCAQAKLVVELDGASHLGREKYDRDRTIWLEVCDLEVVRYPNDMVFNHLDDLKASILEHCKRRTAPSPLPGLP